MQFKIIELPEHVTVQQLAVGTIGMWLAILTTTPSNGQVSISFFHHYNIKDINVH